MQNNLEQMYRRASQLCLMHPRRMLWIIWRRQYIR